MSYSLSPNVKARFFITGTNRPLAGGLLYTYLVGTTTPAATYSDNAGTPNTNPIVLNADGECDLYLDDAVSYRFILKNSAGVTQFDEDRISSINSAQLAALDATAALTAADRVQTGLDRVQTGLDRLQTGLDVATAISARDAALLSSGLWPTTAAGIGDGVAGTSGLVAGSGGTDGTFALAFSGGTQVLAPVGYFVVTGGAVTQVVITYKGYYSAGTPTISFAASSGLTGASVTAVMAANTPVNQYFTVPESTDSLILYKVTAGPVAIEQARYATSTAVNNLKTVAGKYNGWPDPFFRRFDLTTKTVHGRDRWWTSVGGSVFNGWTRVAGTEFNGNVLRRTADQGSTPLNGPVIWLDEIGATTGDTVTVYGLFTGSGAVARMPARFDTGVDLSYVGSQINPESITGTQTVTTTSTPQWLRITATVPATAQRLAIYPYTTTAAQTFDFIACWAVKGAAVECPDWPTLNEEAYYRLRDADLSAAIAVNAAQTAELDYMLVSVDVVSASATSTNLAVTAVTTDETYGDPFSGWGERYTPAGISFNAIKIKSVGRNASLVTTPTKWRTLNVVIRTGANSHTSSSTIVAVGSITVNPDVDSLADVTIVLKDPTTGAVKTLTDADFSGGEYFIGVYARSAAGTVAGISPHRATQSNTIGTSYYVTSHNPLTATWLTNTVNQRVGVDHLLLTTPVESVNYVLASGLKGQIDELLLPIKDINTQQTAELDYITAELDYMMVSTGVVTSASSSTNLAVTGAAINTTYSNVFTGWGERYTPAAISFNAVTIKYLGRNIASTTVKWRTLNIVVRTGANSHLAGATVVAIGSITVNPNADTLTNITILLKDPITGAVKTLTDADFTNNEYFIGVYARDASNVGAGMSLHTATQANTLGQSYYITSQDPLTATWLTNTGNHRVGVDHLLLTTPVEGVSYEPSSALLAQIIVPTVLVMPPTIYGVQGRECNVYFDNLYVDDSSVYLQDVTNTAANGAQQRERWTWIPIGAQTTGTLSVSACDKKSGEILVIATANQRAAASTAGSGTTKIINTIGDSLINAGTITQTVIDIASTDVMSVTMIGTRGSGVNKHEGRGGWTINDFATVGRTFYSFTVSGVVTTPDINSTTYTNNGSTFKVQELSLVAGSGTIICERTAGTNAPSASGALTKSSGTGDATISFSASSTVSGNPFWISGALNYAQYLTNNSLPTPDWVVIHLGINDSFGYTTDATVIAAATEAFAKLDLLITSIKAAGAGVKVALMIPTPPANQDAFAANYGTGQTAWRYKRNIMLWSKEMIDKYTGEEANRVYLVPTNTALDVVNGYPLATSAPVNSRSSVMVQRQNNGVHPDTSGYQQIGDALWAFLKCHA